MKKKNYEYITISEVCKKAGVNISTFYLHYSNMSDLLSETIEYLNKKFRGEFNNINMPDVNKADKKDLVFVNHEFLCPYLSYLKKNKKLFLLAKAKPELLVSKSLLKKIDGVITPILNRFNVPEKEKKYTTAFFISGVQAIAMKWIENDCEDEIEYIINLIISYVGYSDDKD